MNDQIAAIALRAAAALSEPGDRRLALQVSMMLDGATIQIHKSLDFTDRIGLAGLIVAAATLAWTIYSDLSASTQVPPTVEQLTTIVQSQLPEGPGVSPTERERLIKEVVRQTLDQLRHAPSASKK